MKTIMIRNVPDDVHKKLRHLAVEKDVSMNVLLNQLIEKAVKENK